MHRITVLVIQTSVNNLIRNLGNASVVLMTPSSTVMDQCAIKISVDVRFIQVAYAYLANKVLY
jgi:hypothetical protein